MTSSHLSSPELGPDLAGDSGQPGVGVGNSLHAATCSHLPHLVVSTVLHLSFCLSSMAVADADLAEGPPPWTPALPTSEVTVTDITANSITVTFREAQAAEGFFRDRSGKF